MATDTEKTNGIIYFRLTEPRYEGDTTKNCGLTGGEIDKNFNFLRGYDIEKGSWDSETKMLILERLNGEKLAIALPVDGSGSTEAISFEGSEFLSESGGTLSLVANGGEPYLITGFTECCEELIEALNILGEKIDNIGSDVINLIQDYDDEFIQVYKVIDENAQREFETIRKLTEDVCEIKRSLASEIQKRKALETKIIEEVSDIVENLSTEVNNVKRDTSASIQNLSQEIGGITRRETEQDERIQRLAEELNNAHNELTEAIAREKRNRKESIRNLRETVEQKLSGFETRLAALSNNCASIFENIENKFARISQHEQQQDEKIASLNTKIDEKICDVNEKIAREKKERIDGDKQLSNTIRQKVLELSELIGNEAVARSGADDTLHGLINNEVAERQREVRRLEGLVQTEKNSRIGEDNNIKSLISIQRNQTERLIDEEKRARQYQNSVLQEEISNRLITVGENIDEIKGYAKWLYYGSAQNLLLPCDERKWGIAIRDINEGEYAGRREIYLNLNPNDKFLSQDCNYLASYISLKYNKDNNHIELIGRDGIVASYIDANIFIQKGFLVRSYFNEINKNLVFVWDSGDTTIIPARDIFDPEAGNGIKIEGQKFSIEIGNNDEGFLHFRNGGLVTIGIKDAIDTSSANLRLDIEALINQKIAAINAQLSGISENISEIEQNMVTNDEFNGYTARTDQILSGLSQDILDLGTRFGQQLEELRSYVDGEISGISAAITDIEEDIEELKNKVVYLSDFNAYTAETKSKIEEIDENISGITEGISGLSENIRSIQEDVSALAENVDSITDNVSALTEDVETLKDNVSAQNEHIDEIENTISGLSTNVSKNSQDIEELFEIIESGGGGTIREIVSRDDSVSVKDEGDGVINLEVKTAPVELVSRDDSIKIEEESGGTINIEVNSAPVKITSSDDSLNVSEESGVTNIVISQIFNPEIEIEIQ